MKYNCREDALNILINIANDDVYLILKNLENHRDNWIKEKSHQAISKMKVEN